MVCALPRSCSSRGCSTYSHAVPRLPPVSYAGHCGHARSMLRVWQNALHHRCFALFNIPAISAFSCGVCRPGCPSVNQRTIAWYGAALHHQVAVQTPISRNAVDLAEDRVTCPARKKRSVDGRSADHQQPRGAYRGRDDRQQTPSSSPALQRSDVSVIPRQKSQMPSDGY